MDPVVLSHPDLSQQIIVTPPECGLSPEYERAGWQVVGPAPANAAPFDNFYDPTANAPDAESDSPIKP